MSETQFFGRAWKVTIDTAAGEHLVISSDQFSEPLRVTFNIEMRALLAYWQAEIVLYNASFAGQDNGPGTPVIAAGDVVSVSAGYQFSTSGKFDPDANLLFQGNVFQVVQTRQNVVDATIKLRCVLGLMNNTLNFVSFSLCAGIKPIDIVRRVCIEGSIPVESVDAAPLSIKAYTRGSTYHGRPNDILRQVAKENGLQAWVSPKGLNMRTMIPDAKALPVCIYAPTSLPGPYAKRAGLLVKKTLLGTPAQSQNGISFRVLMDAEPKLGDIVQVAAGTSVTPFEIEFQKDLPVVPNADGLYTVIGIRIVGDSRGNDWYTEYEAVTLDYFPKLLAAAGITA